MKNSCLNYRCFSLNLLHGIIFLCITSVMESADAAGMPGNDTDRLALLDFKNRITQDPLRVTSSWNGSVHFCNWTGVSCSPSNERVVALNLDSQRLAGSIPPSIGNLTFLTKVHLRDNYFHGELPQELGFLQRLQDLNLSSNSFEGKIPTNLSQCKQLRIIGFGLNNFIGEIPSELSMLSHLVVLELGGNNMTGKIPSWIGNFSSLFGLALGVNKFYGGIPNELGKLSRLGFFSVFSNYLSGSIPPSIYNISSIYYFSVTQNQLHGELPSDVGLTIPSLRIFAGGVNNFTGTIPVSLSNASGLQVIDFALNGFTGTIPRNLGSLRRLVRLNFDNNYLGNGGTGDLAFLSSVANCTSLEVLGLAYNRFGGELPSSIANLSTQLQILTAGGNLIHGTIPIGVANLVNLILLSLEINNLNDSVPDVIGKLHALQVLELHDNQFSGLIPSSLGNLTRLSRLLLNENQFEGSIPPSLGKCQNLQYLTISGNRLTGTIPTEIFTLSSLSIALVMSHNSLTGSLPAEVGNLINLVEFDVSENKLSGEIPSTLGSCTQMERLYLEGNEFQGTIPETLKSLRGIEDIDLSCNNFSGKIPDFLGELVFLKHLNLSYNILEGEVSRKGIFGNMTAISVTGNDKLCGGIPELLLPMCSKKANGQPVSRKLLEIIAIIAIIFLAIVLCSVTVFCYVRRTKTHSTTLPPSGEFQSGMSYAEIARSTNDFSAENLIGSGSFGSVYKGVLAGDGRTVAIKVLNLQQKGASKSFIAECDALRSIRHRNLLKIITVCSTVDHQGNDFKGLVFEFMSNGSLDQWLDLRADEGYQTMRLSLLQRLDIAIDVAAALDYLHHDCETPIVHCDLKPSNVLLDEDMTAHVGDFGLARFLFESPNDTSEAQGMSVSLKGSIGYIPPEYGQDGQVSTLGDTYSYGILLLEMFTGKRPTDEIFQDDLTIHKFVSMALPEHVMTIIDQSMLVEEENEYSEKAENPIEEQAMIRDGEPSVGGGSRIEIEECLVSIMGIGLSCSARTPVMRMGMNLVYNKLQRIRDSLLRSKNRSRRRFS